MKTKNDSVSPLTSGVASTFEYYSSGSPKPVSATTSVSPGHCQLTKRADVRDRWRKFRTIGACTIG